MKPWFPHESSVHSALKKAHLGRTRVFFMNSSWLASLNRSPLQAIFMYLLHTNVLMMKGLHHFTLTKNKAVTLKNCKHYSLEHFNCTFSKFIHLIIHQIKTRTLHSDGTITTFSNILKTCQKYCATCCILISLLYVLLKTVSYFKLLSKLSNQVC